MLEFNLTEHELTKFRKFCLEKFNATYSRNDQNDYPRQSKMLNLICNIKEMKIILSSYLSATLDKIYHLWGKNYLRSIIV